MASDFTLEDLRQQLAGLREEGLTEMGKLFFPRVAARQAITDWPRAFAWMERILDAMTAEERCAPSPLSPERRQQVADAASVEPDAVADLESDFSSIRELIRRMAKMTILERMQLVKQLGAKGLTA